jgi:ATP-grasp domain/L-amino acid ligase C-terminal domain 2/ATP-grasp N-terminal domain
MTRLLLLAATTGYQTRAFGEAAEQLGVELVFATDRCHLIEDPWQDRAIPIRFHDEDASVAAILDSASLRPLDGLLVVGDRPTVIAARAAERLGLPWHPAEGAAAARHKERTRERLRDAGLAVPWWFSVGLNDQPSTPQASGSRLTDPSAIGHEPSAVSHQPLMYPCVVKPVSLSGSRGVMRADDPAAFGAVFERLRALMRSAEVRAERNEAHDMVLVEGFIPGREYAVEALLHRGVLRVLAIFDKPDPLDGPFFEETIYVTPSSASASLQALIVEAVTRAALALGLYHGPVHAECRVNDRGVFVLEVAARPIGGLCARALRFTPVPSPESLLPITPKPKPLIPLEELLLRHALGEDPAMWRREGGASGVMMIPIPRRGIYRGVDGIGAARQVPAVDDVRITAKADQLLVPLPEGASYLGFIFARAERSAGVEEALRAAHAQLTFAIDAELPVLTSAQIHYNQPHG